MKAGSTFYDPPLSREIRALHAKGSEFPWGILILLNFKMALLRGLIRPANCREYYLRWSMESPLVAAILTNRLTNAQAKSMDHMGTNIFDTLVVVLLDICGCGMDAGASVRAVMSF